MNRHNASTPSTALSNGAPKSLKELEKEKWQSIVQIHKLQELLEQLNVRNCDLIKKNQELQFRIDRIASQNPGIWEYEALTAQTRPEQNDIILRIENAYLNNRLIPRITVSLSNDDGEMCLNLWDTSRHRNEAFIECKNSHHEPSIRLTPGSGSPLLGENLVISSLSTTDWRTLVDLVRKIHNQFYFGLVAGCDKKEISSLDVILKKLEDWPPVLRFDEIEYLASDSMGEYESLSFRLKNINFGNNDWPELYFRMGTVAKDGKFDQYPRLEFPAISRAALESWYAETDDLRGERLELRYALPDDIDAFIWQQLTSKDKCLITAIIFFLPQLVNEALPRSEHSENQKWRVVANTIRRIHLSYLKVSGI